MIRTLLLILALLVWAPAAQAQTFPKLTGRVVDEASLLSPAQEQALTDKLAGLEKQSGRQLVVATVPDLQGYDISDFAYRLGRAWAIGNKDRDDGTLLLVAPKERKVWIATGYGVEGVVTDALAARIYRNAIIPRFKAGDFPGGIEAGVDQLATLLSLPPDEARAQAAAAEAEDKKRAGSGGGGFMIIFWIIVLVVILGTMAGSRGKRGRRYRGGAAPIILWGPSDFGDNSGSSSWGGSSWGGGDGGGFSGGGGSFGGGGAGGSW
ncbi:MAG TPA: TPM domain-containing protein [Sphingobium sp.]|nr:TPM domain-containing protein [Sphingobium sp.]